MASKKQVDILLTGVEQWNAWRERNPTEEIDLSEFNFEKANDPDYMQPGIRFFAKDLRGARFEGANLHGTKFRNAKLDGAVLEGAKCTGSEFDGACLRDSWLEGAKFSGASLCGSDMSNIMSKNTNFFKAKMMDVDLSGAYLPGANFSEADLAGINFTNADIEGANLTGANLRRANFANANIAGVIWVRKRMRGKFGGVRGIESAWGNALFRRDVLDQDYLDTLEESLHKNRGGRFLFYIWSLIDFGRSLSLVSLLGSSIVILFGVIYRIFDLLKLGDGSAKTNFSPFFFSIVTFTTLGYGDVTPRNLIGEVAASIEVTLGYLTLGLLLSVLANKVARRS